jgi:hypothetical protein
MGGDGGVIASDRRYMRGAGLADHTGDHRNSNKNGDPAVRQEQARRDFRTCAVSNQPLFGSSAPSHSGARIVACPRGRLYDKERAIQAVLDGDERVSHVRGLRDLVDVRFHFAAAPPVPAPSPDGTAVAIAPADGSWLPSCPVTGKELNGLIPAYVVVPGNPDQPNVVSERGLQMKELVEEYGPADRTLRLFPPKDELEKIKEEERAARQHAHPPEKKKKKKRKRDKNDMIVTHKKEKKGRSEARSEE